MDLRQVVNRDDTPAGRSFHLTIQVLIVLSLVSFSIETLPNLSVRVRAGLRAFEIFTVAVFTVEYVLRVALAERKLKFVFSFYGLIDLFAILPFYVATGIDLQSIRVFRVFRLVRVLKLLRYRHAAERLRNVFISIRAEMALFTIACAFLIYLMSVGIYYFEREMQSDTFGSVFARMW